MKNRIKNLGNYAQKGNIPWNKGKDSPKMKGNTNGFKKGDRAWNTGIKGIMKPNSTSFKKGVTPWNKGKKGLYKVWNKGIHTGIAPWLGKKRPNMSGENHPMWQGGKTALQDKIKNSLEYKIWRRAIFERDHYTCILCSNNKSGNLEADHIKPQSLFTELRFDINNGRTLCRDCHRKTDTYGNHRFKIVLLPQAHSLEEIPPIE